jgi:uncharacterized Fe-S cluster-containing protein
MSDKGIYVCRGPDSKTDKITGHIIRNIVVPLLTKSFPDIITSKKGNICLNIKYQ